MFTFLLYFILSKAKNTKTKAPSLFKNENQGKKTPTICLRYF